MPIRKLTCECNGTQMIYDRTAGDLTRPYISHYTCGYCGKRHEIDIRTRVVPTEIWLATMSEKLDTKEEGK